MHLEAAWMEEHNTRDIAESSNRGIKGFTSCRLELLESSTQS